jgi:predicted DNA-binding transcriptional regulator AlpA
VDGRPGYRNCTAGAAAGRFVELPAKAFGAVAHTKTLGAGAPPLGYSIREFCKAVGISVSLFYELQASGLAPRTMALAKRRKIIAIEEAQRWCRERTEASAIQHRG